MKSLSEQSKQKVASYLGTVKQSPSVTKVRDLTDMTLGEYLDVVSPMDDDEDYEPSDSCE